MNKDIEGIDWLRKISDVGWVGTKWKPTIF
jgi:hypothetical protein